MITRVRFDQERNQYRYEIRRTGMEPWVGYTDTEREAQAIIADFKPKGPARVVRKTRLQGPA